MNFLVKYKLLLIITFFGLLVRILALNFSPPSLNWDEVSHGYNAYSILNTGRDEWGEFMPFIFRAYGDYKLPVYIYTTVPFVWVLGLNVYAVRLPSVLAGVGVIIFIYFLVNKLSKNRKLALVSAALVAFEPWTFFVSRAALEANLALFLIVSATYYFFSASKKYSHLIFSAVLFGLAVWTYNTARIFVPLFIFLLLLQYRDQIFNRFSYKRLGFAASILLVFIAPMFYQLLMPQGQARYDLVAILDPAAIGSIEQMRASSEQGLFVTRLLYNRVTYFIPRFSLNYISHFTPKYLFFQGSGHYQFSQPGFGLLSFVNIIPFYWGVISFCKKRKKWQILVLGWLFLGPIASSVTRESPHALRSLVMAPAVMTIAAYGVLQIYNLIKKHNLKHVLLAIFLLVLFLSYEKYYYNYFTNYRKEYSWSWQYGNEELVQSIKVRYGDYDAFIVTKNYGEPHEFILFYWPWNPADYLSDPSLIRFNQSNWYWVDRFDRFYFVNDWQIAEGSENQFKLESGGEINCNSIKCLLITSPGNAPANWNKIEEIRFLDNKKAYEIYER